MASSQIRFDFRMPGFAPYDRKAQYDAALEMAAWADEQDERGPVR